MKVWRIILKVLLINMCNCANILIILSNPENNNMEFGESVILSVVQKGHNVTLVSHEIKQKHTNVNHIVVNDLIDPKSTTNPYWHLKTFFNEANIGFLNTNNIFANLEFKAIVKGSKNFDLVILDAWHNNAFLSLGVILNAPIILLSPNGNTPFANFFTANSLPHSYVPSTGYFTDDNLGFYDRFYMNFCRALEDFYMWNYQLSHHADIVKATFNNTRYVETAKWFQNVALVLANSHFSVETARPWTSNIIPIAGITIKEKQQITFKKLPDLIDLSDEGFIFVNLDQHFLTHFNTQTFLDAFSIFSQHNFLWNYELDFAQVKRVPGNVLIGKFNQKDILAHSKVIGFITHGDMVDLIDSLSCQVPLIVLPYHRDQFSNAKFVESRKLGECVDLINLTAATLYDAIISTIINVEYKENLKLHSSLLKNQPIKPADNAIFWIEHVLKHNKSNHLKPFSFNLQWYENYMVDVLSILITAAFLLLYFINYLYNRLDRYLFSLCEVPKKENSNDVVEINVVKDGELKKTE